MYSIPLKKVSSGGMEGYLTKDLTRLFKRQGRLQEWYAFINGQTGGITENGKFFSYEEDVIRFLEKCPVID